MIAVAAAALLTGPAQPAAAAPTSSCSFADPGSGTYANTICWLDLSAYSEAQATSASGQAFSFSLPGGYTLAFNLNVVGGVTPRVTSFPIYPGVYLGGPGHYSGVQGSPALDTQANGNVGPYTTTATQSNVTLTDSAGRAVTGWSLVSADAESTDNDEALSWQSTSPIQSLTAQPNGDNGLGNACGGGFTGVGTNSVTCIGSNTGDKTGAAIIASTSPSTFSQSLTSQGTGAQAVALGVLVSKLTLDKTVSGRINPSDSFDTAITSPEGTVSGSASTGTADTSTTGGVTVLPRTGNSGVYTLSESPTTNTSTLLSNYAQSWSCTNAATGSSTPLPSGTGTSKQVDPAPGDDITCTLTNTALPASLTLAKSANPTVVTAAGQQVTYSFVVTNTGNVTLSGVTVAEGRFTGTGTLSPVTCPAAAASLAPTAQVTCTATYTTTAADINNRQITNTATASGTPPGSTTPVISAPSTVTVSVPSSTTCTPQPILVNTQGSNGQLITYSPAGQALKSVPLNAYYGDIALTASGTLYGVDFGGSNSLRTINPNTGAVTATVAITGVSGTSNFNALSALPNGQLLIARSFSSQVYTLNPTTGAATLYASVPTGYTSAGDFLSLSDGDILASTNGPNGGALVRIHPDLSTTVVGTVPVSYGAAQSGGNIYLAGSNGDLYELSSVPTASAPNTPIATTTLNATGLAFAGATSLGDAGLCSALVTGKTVNPASGTPVRAGQQLTYTLSFDNTAGQAAAPVNYTDDLTGVLDDATVTAGPTPAAGSGLTVSAVSGTNPQQFTVTGQVGVGQAATVTYTVTVNTPDTGDHTLSNYLVPTGTPIPTSCATGDANCTTNPVADLSVVKSANPTTITKAGQTVTYSFLVTNTGNVTLSNVTVGEGTFTGTGTLSPVTCPAGAASLAPTAQVTCTATYTTTQADVDAGGVTNTATATGIPPGSTTPVTSPPSTANVPATPAPALTLVKSATPSGSGTYSAGQPVAYSFLVTNTGNVTLTNVSVNDTAFSGTGTLSSISCPAAAASLAPGNSVTCTATYALTQADVDAGKLSNTATATGAPPNPNTPAPTSPPSTVTIPNVANPSMTLTKTANPTSITAAGQPITYTFVIRNTGNVTLTGVGVTEGSFTGTGTAPTVTCPTAARSLAPGAFVTCTATYTATQADVNAGSVTNTAAAFGTPPGSTTPIGSPPSTATVTAPPNPALTVAKTADPTSITTAGQAITYSFVVTNTGNVTLTNVTVNEGVFTGTGTLSGISCPAAAASLAPQNQVTCTATYTATQADVDAGSVSNTATATGTPPNPNTPAPTSPPSTAKVTATPTPGITMTKTATPTTVTAAGQQITYSFKVTNTGNVTLAGVTVDEGAFTGTGTLSQVTCPAGAAALLPGTSVTCTATYTTTQADVDAGGVTNTATATGTPPDPNTPAPTSPPSTVNVPATPAPAITVVKSADPGASGSYSAGQKITYSFLVTNTGNVTLTNVTVDEGAFTGTGTLSAPACPAGAGSLAPGAQVTCTATYTLTQVDVNAGKLTNTATATGTPPNPNTPAPTSPPSTVTIPNVTNPALTVAKTANPATVTAAGQTVTYTFVATNTGNVTLTDVTVNEGAFTGTGTLSPVTCPAAAASVAPGDSVTCTATYTTTQADIDAGAISNTATAAGTPPGSTTPTNSPPSTAKVTAPAAPALTVVKTSDTTVVTAAGQTITYSFAVTNTGNVTLTNVKPVDSGFTGHGTLSPITCPTAANTVAPGATVTCTATYTTVAADLSSATGATLSNTATATGTPPDPTTPAPTSPPSTVTVPVTPPANTGGNGTGGNGIGSSGNTAGGSSGNLPYTGLPVPVWLLVFTGTGMALIGAGMLTITRRRRT